VGAGNVGSSRAICSARSRVMPSSSATPAIGRESMARDTLAVMFATWLRRDRIRLGHERGREASLSDAAWQTTGQSQNTFGAAWGPRMDKRLAIACFGLLLAVSCTAGPGSTSRAAVGGSPGQPTSITSSVEAAAPSSCPDTGCPVPDCRGGVEVHVAYDPGAGSVGTKSVDASLQRWIAGLFGSGEGRGIPTPEGNIAFLVTRDGRDLGLLWYHSDGQGGWLKKSYVACEWAVKQ
jgi:hypothetical protein